MSRPSWSVPSQNSARGPTGQTELGESGVAVLAVHRMAGPTGDQRSGEGEEDHQGDHDHRHDRSAIVAQPVERELRRRAGDDAVAGVLDHRGGAEHGIVDVDHRRSSTVAPSGCKHAVRWSSASPARGTRAGSSIRQSVFGVKAARMEPAAGRRRDRRRHVAGYQLAAPPRRWVGDGHGIEQRPRVRMPGRGEQRVGGGDLDDAPEIHHRDPVGDVLDDAEVVGNDDVGEVELALQALQQVDDLRLYRHVEGRHRLVADDEPRLEGEGAGDADALSLPAGERAGKRLWCSGLRPTSSISS